MQTSSNHRFRVYDARNMGQLPRLQALPESERTAMRAVAAVFPFRVNNYVVEELINWSDVPGDPIFQLTFPQPGMLEPDDFARMIDLIATGAPVEGVSRQARLIQQGLNPQPAGQLDLNVPWFGDEPVPGVQHKYRETVLFFPSAGQTCHAYCSYCFRWAQFVGLDDLKFASRESATLVRYLKARPEVTSVLITGGDPMVMKARVLRRFLEPLLDPALEHIDTIRIGSKSLAYWPFRFTTDDDADELLRLFEQVRACGKHLAFMAHFSHPRELETDVVQAAARRILDTGAAIRTQAPVIRHVNDDADAWARMWRMQTRLGMVPYYMFVARNTGANHYFEVPLARTLSVYAEAWSRVSGLARTARGPCMSATAGKVVVDGISEIHGEKVFALRFLQGRSADWVGRPFFASYDEEATWFSDLRPAFGENEFFFEPELRDITENARQKHALPIGNPGILLGHGFKNKPGANVNNNGGNCGARTTAPLRGVA